MWGVIVHGGAGSWKKDRVDAGLRGCEHATRAAAQVLADGGTAMDAAIAAVVCLEDDPTYNAGTGSSLNLDGEVEMDAAVMDGPSLRTGAVAGLRRVKNPCLVARTVMEKTDHVLLAGEGAARFARALGFDDYDPITDARRESWERRRLSLREEPDRWLPELAELIAEYPDLTHGTVGACACDEQGRTAAVTSTGGVVLKLVGRVGDTAVPGAGNYANAHGAASATGKGELFLRNLGSKVACDHMAAGLSALDACDELIAEMSRRLGDQTGIIAIDRLGRPGLAHATDHLPHAWMRSADAAPVSGMTAAHTVAALESGQNIS